MKKVEVQKKTKYSRQKEQFQQDKMKEIQWDQNKSIREQYKMSQSGKDVIRQTKKKGHLKDCGLTPPK